MLDLETINLWLDLQLSNCASEIKPVHSTVTKILETEHSRDEFINAGRKEGRKEGRRRRGIRRIPQKVFQAETVINGQIHERTNT